MVGIINIIGGRLGGDPIERETQKGTKVLSFSIASSYKSGSKENTIWYRGSVWGEKINTIKNILPYLKKGSKVVVSGEISNLNAYINRNEEANANIELNINYISFAPSSVKKETSEEDQSSAFQEASIGAKQNEELAKLDKEVKF